MFKNAKVHPGVCDPGTYHESKIKLGPRGSREYTLSPSTLKEFARCPSRWVKGYNPPESKAKDWGSLLDCMVLTPELLDKRYAIQPATYTAEKGEVKKWNNNATVCRKWVDEQEQAGKEIVSAKEIEQAHAAATTLLRDTPAGDFIVQSDKQVLVTAEWHDEETGLVIPVCCLIDLVPRKDSEFANCLGDLTTANNASDEAFTDTIHRFGYDLQAAFDRDIYEAATGEARNTWCFIVQESFEPFEVSGGFIKDDAQEETFFANGRVKYKRALRDYCKCLKSGKWFGYRDNDCASQGWSFYRPTPWMSQKLMFSPRFESQAEIEPETDDVIP